MPVAFGPQPGPRQRPDGGRWNTADRGTATVLSVSFTSKPEALTALLPPKLVLDGQPVVTVQARALRDLPWLAGRGYDLMMLRLPARHPSSGSTGDFELVTWENLADPIISGREELGFAKLPAQIHGADIAQDADSAVIEASWDGWTFLTIEAAELTTKDSREPRSSPRPLLHHRYMPQLGVRGAADIDDIVAETGQAPEMRTVWSRHGSGRVRFHPGGFEQLPTLHHVIDPLAALPGLGDATAELVHTTGYCDQAESRVLPSE